MSMVSSALLLGLQYALLALGVYITFRVLNIPDLTVDGSFTLGAAVSAVLCVAGHPFAALLAATLCGAAAGCVTGFLQTKAGIHPILAGILTMSGLYTVNMQIMGMPNVTLLGKPRFYEFLFALFPNADKDLLKTVAVFVICAALILLLILFFRTVFGLCIRATGNNEDMVRASSINTNVTKIAALAIANALVALSGGLIAQTGGFADINGGSGMIVVGLASVIIGEVLFGKRSLAVGLISAAVGSVVYRLIIALALKTNFFTADALKLLSAVIVGITLAAPAIRKALSEARTKREARKHA
ncbi:MAG: ABC transporter permease [Clostridia bacterium]|nr:ABC transporter permease [Clostridia bacterium]